MPSSERKEKRKKTKKRSRKKSPEDVGLLSGAATNTYAFFCDWGTSGTTEADDSWLNTHDCGGMLMATVTWLLLIFADLVIVWIVDAGRLSMIHAILYNVLTLMAMCTHMKVMLTDPGAVPRAAIPLLGTEAEGAELEQNICGRCDAYKPPRSHHCRICNRCIVRMDHHCPWMNNCIGANNQKHFLIFLVYTSGCALYSIGLVVYHYIACKTDACDYSETELNLVRAMLVVAVMSLLFTSSMLMNQIYGVTTGIGTIDRMRLRGSRKVEMEPVPWRDVFGTGSFFWWLFPTDVQFEDFFGVMGYSLPQRPRRAKGGSKKKGGTEKKKKKKKSGGGSAASSDISSTSAASARV